MGYYKDLDIDRIENAQARLAEREAEVEAERVAASFLQPTLGKEFSDYPEAETLLDFVRAFNARKAAVASKELVFTIAN